MNEHGELPDISNVNSNDITSFVKAKLSATGFNVKILRVNPSDWTYKDLFNLIMNYENQGYEIQSLCVDYLSMLPTTGCVNNGPTGTDLRDLFRRTRNFCSARDILFLTPHQMSSDAKKLIRNGVPDSLLVKEVAGKGYYSGSTQLDQEIDLELYGHIAKANKKTYLTIQRGKHRLPTTIDDDDMYFLLPFPKNGPIPHDLDKEDISLRDISELSDDNFGI